MTTDKRRGNRGNSGEGVATTVRIDYNEFDGEDDLEHRSRIRTTPFTTSKLVDTV